MRHARIRVLSLLAVIALAVGGAACGGGGGIKATLSNFKIELGSSTAKSGEVTFDIKNNGPSVHEFVVFKTDLAPDQLPTTEENGVTIVDEEGEGIEAIDEKEDIAVDASTSLTVTLAVGKYVLLCNRPQDGGHYEQGMHTAFTVTG
ncbi:MAG TPA: hypothetical protein VGR13_04115 [Actinomycetota bacterium]|nr:hypothetical protein [Actinomycetota bacterium]